jgi:hypothetical protein
MEKYRLLKGFRKGFSISGSTPVYFDKKKGDIVEGTIINAPNETPLRPIFLRVSFLVQGQNKSVDIPVRILKKVGEFANNENRSRFEGDNTENNPTSIFTMRNVIMGLVGIAVVYGILKVTKVIK